MSEGPSVLLGRGPEFDRIRAIAVALGNAAAGLGDDCALVDTAGGTLALSIDTSTENVHFRREWLTLQEIGWRAAAGALSDLAAVGAEPLGVLAAVAVPRDAESSVPVDLMRGVGTAAASVGARVLGGDLSAGPCLALAITVLGSVDRPMRRQGARPGDAVWITGTLGGARAALAAWRAGEAPGPDARARFARPEPRIAAGRWLRGLGVTSAIDVSDGLAGDAQHLAAASGVGIALELDHLPLGPGVSEAAEASGEPAPVFAAKGGEDYELLVTLPPDVDPGDGPVAITRIGRVTAGSDVVCRLEGRAIAIAGFDHFA